MSIELAYKYFGKEGKTPLVILHGLMGSSRNWATIGRDLSNTFDVFAPDFRNHGHSPHLGPMDYPTLVEDIFCWIKDRELGPIVLMGHSMGGKTAMALACQHPTLVRALVVVDMAPKNYPPPAYIKYLQALLDLDLKALEKREEADEHLKEKIPNDFFRQFLLTGLERGENGSFRWKHNIPLLIETLPNLIVNSIGSNDHYQGPTLFIRGEKSEYIEDPDLATISWHFSRSRVYTIPNASHYPHVENKAAFLDTFYQFMQQVLGTQF